MPISDDDQSHKSKLVYLWPALGRDMREAAQQLAYYGYQAELIDTPEQLIHGAATEPPTGILIDGSLAGDLAARHRWSRSAYQDRQRFA